LAEDAFAAGLALVVLAPAVWGDLVFVGIQRY
jgi:hypothetical protein